MFHQIDFTKIGGFPLTQNAMQFIQESYNEALEAASRIGGQYIILSGLTEAPPNNFSGGWVIFNGEIVPFAAGLGQSDVKIVETYSGLTFRDGSTPIVYTVRTAQFTAPVTGSVPFTSFQRLNLEILKTQVNAAAATAGTALALAMAVSSSTQSFTPGMILMWTGNPLSLPLDWHLCDGAPNPKVGSTVVIPNLRGKFIVGYSANTGTYTMGAQGGVASVTLSVAQMPSHTHTMASAGLHQHYVKEVDRGEEGSSGTDQSVGSWNETGAVKDTNETGAHTHSINTAGSGNAHENRPPYYALAYIVKL
jgi:microcystin-dependent protein